MWTEEVPWMLAFFLALLGVELQFKYCIPCLRLSLKTMQAFTIIFVIRLWANRDLLLDPEQWQELDKLRVMILNKTI